MSILIKGMEMPKSCGDCPIGDALGCSLMPKVPASWKEYTIAVRTNRRHSDCPLVPVPPHGDLIDYDFCMENYELMHDDDGNPVYAVRMRDIINAPTVIPADNDINVIGKEEGEL